jgi:hypothetical protein
MVIQLDEMFLVGRSGVDGLFGDRFMRTRVMRLNQGKTLLNQATTTLSTLFLPYELRKNFANLIRVKTHPG